MKSSQPRRIRTRSRKRAITGPVVGQWALVFVFCTATLLVGDAAFGERRRGTTSYTVQEGDRIITLAKRFKVSVDAILAANGLPSAKALKFGQKIIIPPPGTKQYTAKRKNKAFTYRVRKGDRLVTLAKRFGTTVDDILDANGLTSAKQMQAGQQLVIPGKGKGGRVTKAQAKTKAQKRRKREPAWMVRARKLARKLGLGTKQVASGLIRGRVQKRWIRAAGGMRPIKHLRFPVVGGVAGRGWGSGTGNYHRALDIPGKMRARVNAAERGIVAYAGNGLAGFGNLVIVIHPGGILTLYAHNDEFKTVAGEKVKRGTRIALLGNSGISRGPHVHFEVIYKGQLCDPLPLFRPVPKKGSGRPALRQRDLLTWPRKGGPPKGLRCGPRKRHPAYVGRPRGVRIPDDEQAEILAAKARAKNGGAAPAKAPTPEPKAPSPPPKQGGGASP